MMVNIDQLTNSVTSLSDNPNFMRHIIFGLLAIFVSFVILQSQDEDSRDNEVSRGIIAYICHRFIQSTLIAVATWIISIWTFILRIAGTTLGVGLGLGLAGHIYDSLDDIHSRHKNKSDDGKARSRSTSITAKIPNSPYAASDDPNSYHALMKSAGYNVDNATLRAQMVRGERADLAKHANGARSGHSTTALPRPSVYKFDKGDTAFSRMKSMWPNLSPAINESLAKLTEFVLRDYVASWYGKIDENVPYEFATTQSTGASVSAKGSESFEKQERRATLANSLEVSALLNSTTTATSLSSHGKQSPSSQLSRSLPISGGDTQNQQPQNRTMVLTTTGTLPSTFIDALYTSFAYLLGTLATRASENVNVLELLLLQLPHVLGKNLKVYRELKNVALEKKRRREGHTGSIRPGSRRARTTNGASSLESQQSICEEDVSEIAIIREYLLAGRLHRALTFGLDVPSLLFADPHGKDCPPSESYKEIQDRLKFKEDSVLEDRLLSAQSTLVTECELDYNRVMASKISKLVLPKSEIESYTVRSMLVEMLASCVLLPVMGCFVPDSVNGWIITGLQLLLDDNEADNGTAETGASMARTESDSSLDGTTRSMDGTNRSLLSISEGNHASQSHSENEDMGVILETVLGGETMSDVLGDASITSELDETIFDDTSKLEDQSVQLASCAKSEQLITLLSMSIIELRNFVDFDDCRYAKEHNQDLPVNWDDHRAREAIRHLVLVIEAALLLGARPERKLAAIHCSDSINHEMVEATLDDEGARDGDDFEVDIDVVSESRVPVSSLQQHNSISSVLMELTGDIDAFEKSVSDEDSHTNTPDDDSIQDIDAMFSRRPSELSTLRTLIAAWLHTGQTYRVLSIICKAQASILRPFYFSDAFIRRDNYIVEFCSLLRQLDGIEILVDTTAVLASKCLLMNGGGLDSFERQLVDTIDNEEASRTDGNTDALASGILKQVGSVRANFVQNKEKLARFATESFNFGKAECEDPNQVACRYHQHNQGTPAYLQFNKNNMLASSLRTDRQRRLDSWQRETSEREKLDMVCRSKGASEKDALMQRELHHLARFFYSNTNEIMIEPCSAGDASIISESAANITVKAIAPRRKIEVPEEDSSFLLRAQPRALKPVAIHRDQKQASLACKIYVAMYEEPAIHPKTKRFYGGKYLRQCLLKYFPNDKTASVSIANDLTVMDGRVGQPSVKDILSEEFQKTRHSCIKVGTSSSLLASPLMEPNDFTASPRTGKAVDFIYRVPFFDRPKCELGGKRFVIHDASALLHHRASASSLELSDAALTAAVILRGSTGLNACMDQNMNSRSFSIKISDDGSPLVLLRANVPRKEHGTKEEARSYRPSFLRAALLVQSARQEAQSQCLSYCIKNGSARVSSKMKSENWLQPTLSLLHYANSRRKEEQFLIRDLHLGMNHIDRAQLVRNGLLYPRYPTILRGLTVKVIGAVEIKAPATVDLLVTPTITLFKIRCTAITEFIGKENGDDSKSRYFREEWMISRSLRDFAVFHKHIKSQVAPTEHSASTGAKLVGAATAALTIVGGNQVVTKKERGPMVPSLSKATQVGALGLSSKRVAERRKKLLEEYLQYLTAPNNLLSRCPELLTFLGAYTSIFSAGGNDCTDDDFGREDATRVELDTDKLKAGIVHVKPHTEQRRPDATPKLTNKRASITTPQTGDNIINQASPEPLRPRSADSSQVADKKQPNLTRRMAMIRSQEVNLRDVRRSMFRLLSDIFDLDSASFFRSRVISVIKTMSLAFTNVQDFQLMLFKSHIKYMNGEWVSGWIFYLVDMFWPNGVFYTKGSDLTEREQLELKVKSKRMLEQILPLQLKTVLGRHSDEGLDLLHEMLQNRLVLKSIAYMLLDLVWAEIFPELIDFTSGAECLEKDV